MANGSLMGSGRNATEMRVRGGVLSGYDGGIENVSTAGLSEDRERKTQLQDIQEGLE